MSDPGESGVKKAWYWVRKQYASLLMLLLVIVITAVLFIFRDKVSEFGNYGYLGAFLISLVTNGTIILPMPGILLLFALGASFNPFLIGIAGGAGGILGELTGYVAGYSGGSIVSKNQAYINTVKWVRRWGAIVVFIFSATPLPMDILGIVAGALRYPVWKFLLVGWVGKSLLYTGMALAGAWGWEMLVDGSLNLSGFWIACAVVLGVILLLLLALALEKWSWRRAG